MAPGDVLVLSATDALTKQTYVLASFHGDTDGLATVPVVKAMSQLLAKQLAGTRHVFGMDANTYAVGSAKQARICASHRAVTPASTPWFTTWKMGSTSPSSSSSSGLSRVVLLPVPPKSILFQWLAEKVSLSSGT